MENYFVESMLIACLDGTASEITMVSVWLVCITVLCVCVCVCGFMVLFPDESLVQMHISELQH